MRVRRLPIVLDAEEWRPGREIVGVTEMGCCEKHLRGFIQTLEGLMTVSPGDFIITGRAGEKWAIKPKNFWETYEKVEDVC